VKGNLIGWSSFYPADYIEEFANPPETIVLPTDNKYAGQFMHRPLKTNFLSTLHLQIPPPANLADHKSKVFFSILLLLRKNPWPCFKGNAGFTLMNIGDSLG